MIKVNIIADSINRDNDRITTFVLTYPRFIHAELMTHRLFSRNSASSRAIPIEKMVAAVRDNPAIPEFWGRNQKGMQSFERMDDGTRDVCSEIWFKALSPAMYAVNELTRLGLHKQWTNRLIEPWSHITVIVTSTEYHNFFGRRAHPDAMPDFQVLAYRMLDKYLNSIPKSVEDLRWHIPYGDRMRPEWTTDTQIRVAVARCARVSYLTQDGEIDLDKDFELYERLRSSGHWSPFEHVAKATPGITSGNFTGWRQHRKDFIEENGRGTDLKAVMATKPEWITL